MLNRIGLPNTRNVIQKWSLEHLRGVDITRLGPPPKVSTTIPYNAVLHTLYIHAYMLYCTIILLLLLMLFKLYLIMYLFF